MEQVFIPKGSTITFCKKKVREIVRKVPEFNKQIKAKKSFVEFTNHVAYMIKRNMNRLPNANVRIKPELYSDPVSDTTYRLNIIWEDNVQ